jgi:YbbR domain-containing protein
MFRRLVRALTRNFGWKIGSLVLAVLLWFAIVGEPEMATTHAVPILYRNLPQEMLIGSDALDTVRLELRGPAGRLTAGSLADLAVVLDLSNVKGPGEQTFTLSDSDLRVPDGVTFVRAIPSQLRIRFARRKVKDAGVEVRISAPPPAGFEIVRQEVIPSVVQIAGPEHRLDAITSTQTDAIDLSGVTRAAEFHVNTSVTDPQVWLQSPAAVTVRVTVEKTGKK